MKKALAIDVGGTTVKTGLVGEDGSLENPQRFPTPQGPGAGHTLLEQLSELCRNSQADAIGIGTPGLVDQTGSLVSTSENIQGWGPLAVQELLQQHCSQPVCVINDVNAAAYAEFKTGAGRDCRSMVMLALGTGLGGGVIADGELVIGHNGLAGEFGMMVVEPYGREGNSSIRGNLEAYASATGISVSARELADTGAFQNSPLAARLADRLAADPEATVKAHELYQALEKGDSLARAVNELTSEMLARGIGAVIASLAPEAVILGGGVMKAGDLILDCLQKYLVHYTYGPMLSQTAIRIAEHSEAGILGAGLFAIDHIMSRQKMAP
ncbi:ROK family protein [Spirochaeta dissipatitropha]